MLSNRVPFTVQSATIKLLVIVLITTLLTTYSRSRSNSRYCPHAYQRQTVTLDPQSKIIAESDLSSLRPVVPRSLTPVTNT